MKIKIGIFIISLFLTGQFLRAQDGSPSPYSFFGLGDQSFKGNTVSIGMGGISVAPDSLHYFINNPASLAQLKFINLNLGINNSFIQQEDASGSVVTSAHNINYFALGIPIGNKLGLGFGILPETSTKYNIYKDEDTGVYSFQGSGGMSRFFLAGAYEINPKLTAAFEYRYHFGFLQHDYLWIPDNTSIYTRDNNYEDFSGSSIKFSLQYQTKLKNRKYFSANIQHVFQTDLNTNFYGDIRLIKMVSKGEILVSKDTKPEADGVLNLPSITTLGLGYGEKNKWFIGSEINFKTMSKFNNPFFDPTYVQYKDAYTLKLGGHYQPEYNSLTNYWKRVDYRAGAFFKNTGMNIYGQDIKDFGITFGLGLPGLKSISNLNLGVELGKRGIKTGNLVLENYFNLHISLSLNDRWFIKRKIN